MKLHNYWRSSASQRVRIGLNLKGLTYEYVAVNIVKQDQFSDAYRAQNPMCQVPTLEVDGMLLTQSLPILEYLEEQHPTPPLLPKSPALRHRVRALAEIVNSGIQPFQNLKPGARVKELGGDPRAFAKPFIAEGLAAYQALCADVAGKFSVGDHPTIADCCLVPQLNAARRFEVDLAPLARLVEIEQHCLALSAFTNAQPDQQPDAVK